MAQNDFWGDVLGVVKAVAPGVATALGGPLAGAAVKFLGSQLLGDENAGQDAVKDALLGASPETLVKLKEIEIDFQKFMTQAGIDLKKMALEEKKAYLANQENARGHFAQNDKVFWLGVFVLAIFALTVTGVLVGAYFLIFESERMSKVDAGILATATGLIGAIIGYASAKADTVIGFFFGSSSSDQANSQALSTAVAGFRK